MKRSCFSIKKFEKRPRFTWSEWRDLNPRPHGPEYPSKFSNTTFVSVRQSFLQIESYFFSLDPLSPHQFFLSWVKLWVRKSICYTLYREEENTSSDAVYISVGNVSVNGSTNFSSRPKFASTYRKILRVFQHMKKHRLRDAAPLKTIFFLPRPFCAVRASWSRKS